MVSTAAAAPPTPNAAEAAVPLWRLHVLRAAYLLLVVGLGVTIVPAVVSHEPMARGVIPSLLGAVWLLAFLGLKYPLKMLPLLLFEVAWKLVWLASFGLAQWTSGQRPPTFAEDFFAIALIVILLPAIPWGYVWRHYVTAPGERWKSSGLRNQRAVLRSAAKENSECPSASRSRCIRRRGPTSTRRWAMRSIT